MSYTRPPFDAADASWSGAAIYARPAHDAADATFRKSHDLEIQNYDGCVNNVQLSVVHSLEIQNYDGISSEIDFIKIHELQLQNYDGSLCSFDFIKIHDLEIQNYDGCVNNVQLSVVHSLEIQNYEFGYIAQIKTLLEKRYLVFGESFAYDADDFLNIPQKCKPTETLGGYLDLICDRISIHYFDCVNSDNFEIELIHYNNIRSVYHTGECLSSHEIEISLAIDLGSIDFQSGVCICFHDLENIPGFKISFGFEEHIRYHSLETSRPEPLGLFNLHYGDFSRLGVIGNSFLNLPGTNNYHGDLFELYTIKTLPKLYKIQKFSDKVLYNEYMEGDEQSITQEYKPFLHRINYRHITLHDFIYKITGGSLPDGLVMDEDGCIHGVIGDLDQMEPTSTLGPSHNWFGQLMDGSYIPYEFIFRFEITSYNALNNEKLASEMCQIRVINNWDCDMKEIMKKIENLSVEYVADVKKEDVVISDPVREVQLCPCDPPVSIGTQIQSIEVENVYKPVQIVDLIETRRKEMNNSLPMEMLFYHSESGEIEFVP